MKRIQFIEWGILAVGILFGYKFFESIFTMVIQLLAEPGFFIENMMVRMLLGLLLYAAAFILLIRNSRSVAIFLNGSNTDDALPIHMHRRFLLQVVLIGICTATALTAITELVLYVFDLFKSDVGRGPLLDGTIRPDTYIFRIALVKLIIALVVIFFSKDIAGWFNRDSEQNELILETKPGEDKDV